MPDSFAPGQIWPDNNGIHINAHGGGILFHDGAYYWFGEHKITGDIGNTAQVGVHCYRSTDLYHWTDCGIALPVHDEPTSDIVRGCILERPKVIYNARTRQFVMWFHLELRGVANYRAARSGVAVSESVAGPYRYLYSLRPNAGYWPVNTTDEQRVPLAGSDIPMASAGGNFSGYDQHRIFRRDFAAGQMARDMTLFVDDDARAYHIYSSEENGVLQISELTDDYLRPAGRYARALPGRFMEGPAIFKYDGRYYLIASDCTGWEPNAARSAVAPNLFGPWTELGNPWQGPPEQADISYDSQSTYVLPVHGKRDAYIFMADRWCPENPIDGRYVWQPVEFRDGRPILQWRDRWDMSIFGGNSIRSK